MMFSSSMSTPIGQLTVIANDSHITAVGFDMDMFHNGNNLTAQGISQLMEYFAGTRREFDLPLSSAGTEFQRSVWQQLTAIKYGNTASYLDIATALNKPTACRAVGAANGKNPISIIVPCHRVIGASGKLTGYAGGLDRKAFLLALEQQYARS